MASAPDDSFYHQIKTSIDFLCKRELNPISLIQSLEILLVEFIETYPSVPSLFYFYLIKRTSMLANRCSV